MMNHCVPDFHEVEDEFPIPMSSGLSNSRPKRPATGEEEIMELLWQNGQVVAQTQKSSKRAPMGDGCEAVITAEQREEEPPPQHLFMQEDEMASLLQYPLDVSTFERDLYAEFLYSAPPSTPSITTIAPPTRPVVDIRPSAPPIQASPRLQNFLHISRIPTRVRNESYLANAREFTGVESNETPIGGQMSHTAEDSKVNVADCGVEGCTLVEAGEFAAGPAEFTVSSSPSCSGASFSAGGDNRSPPPPPPRKPTLEDRKRKGREAGYSERTKEVTEFQATKANPQARTCSTSTKKSRAAEVHNLSERRRRDRINEKMKTLQELIPRCNKSDKASMLDEAIEYLKSLQLQVQMMSMGCGIPMMYPGMQQYMPIMGMGMGLGMTMDMSMNRPVVPYPSMLPGSTLPNPAAGAAAAVHMSACFPMTAFHLPLVPVPDPSRIQPSNQTDPTSNSVCHNPNQPQMPHFNEPHQQFLGPHHAQPQNQNVMQSISKQPSNSKDTGNP